MSDEDSPILRPHTIHQGIRIDDWMKGLDVVVVLESALQNVFRLAHALHVSKCVLVLNMDWTDPSKVPNQPILRARSSSLKFTFAAAQYDGLYSTARALDQGSCSA